MRANKYTGSDTKVLRADIPHQPMGIIAVARDTNNCEYLNTWRLASFNDRWTMMVAGKYLCMCLQVAQCLFVLMGQSCAYLLC